MGGVGLEMTNVSNVTTKTTVMNVDVALSQYGYWKSPIKATTEPSIRGIIETIEHELGNSISALDENQFRQRINLMLTNIESKQE